MPIFPSFFVNKTGAYEIEQSLRFAGGSTQYLYRTGAITAQGGVSLWVKFHRDVGSYTAGVYDPIIYLSGGGPWLYRNNYGYLYYRSISSGGDTTWSAQRTRDHSAWYHIFLKFNSSNSTSLYVNNVLWGTQSTTIGTSSSSQRVGYDGSYFAQYYLAEYHAAFGESLDATDFGQYDDSGVWVPKEFTGNYGSQGFYLKFDPSAINGLGHDHSGNGNHFTNAGGFTTSGTGTDVMSDTPTTNWATLNPLLNQGGSFSDGNLVFSRVGTGYQGSRATIAIPSSGKWYWETTATTHTATAGQWSSVGMATAAVPLTAFAGGTAGSIYYGDRNDSISGIWNGTTAVNQSTTTNFVQGDILQCAYDAGTGKFWFGKNNSWWDSSVGTTGNPSAGTNETLTAADGEYFPIVQTGDNNSNVLTVNFGQRAFAYTPPTGFKALNTSNLPAPDIADGSDYFNTVLYNGNGSTQSITGVGFQPDWVWIKRRDGIANHGLYDSVRGATKALVSSSTAAEVTDANSLTSFDSDGFSASDPVSTAPNLNVSGQTYVAWNWKANGSGSSNTDGSITSTVSANPTAGFSIVSYTAENAVRTIGHGLGVAPVMYMTKRYDAAQDWAMYWELLGATRNIKLNLISKNETDSTYWNNTAPTSTVFTVGTNTRTGGSTGNYIAYCFAEVEGFSKFSEYRGNGSTDGPAVFCGFRPSVLIIKNYAGGSETNWVIKDTVRDTYNPSTKRLNPNLSAVESDDSNVDIDFLSNGFKVRSTNTSVNENGSSYLFMAVAENPFGGSGVSPSTAR